MQISMNGEKRQVAGDSLTIAVLLEMEKVESPEMVSVQFNGDVIDRTLYQETDIGDGDEVDFLYFMGGGSRR
ncbi:MAG: sulfur carrier protein ThiS [Desulfobulbaceae bacterium]|nr:sulfur carrier protein ThiS [Desulfobulbaceae bacterium]